MMPYNIPTLTGRKVVMFPFEDADIDFLIDLHQKFGERMGISSQEGDLSINSYIEYILKQRLLGGLLIWTGWTNEGKAAKPAGFVYLHGILERHLAILQAIYDPVMVKTPRRRRHHLNISHAEEAIRLITDYALDPNGLGLIRLEVGFIPETHAKAMKMFESIGFRKEGLLKSKVIVNGKIMDVALFAKINNFPETKHSEHAEQKKEEILCHQ